MNSPRGSLWPEALSTLDVPTIHRQVIEELRKLVGSLPLESARVTIREALTGYHEIDVIPSNPLAASIQIYLKVCDPNDPQQPTTVICAGVDVGIDLIDIQYDNPNPNIVGYFVDVINAIIAGKLQEKVYYKGGMVIKSKFTVDLGREPLTFTRSSLPNWLKTLLKRKEVKTISYAPYVS